MEGCGSFDGMKTEIDEEDARGSLLCFVENRHETSVGKPNEHTMKDSPPIKCASFKMFAGTSANKKGLVSIIKNLKEQRDSEKDGSSVHSRDPPPYLPIGDGGSADSLENSPPTPSFKTSSGRRRRFDRGAHSATPADFTLHVTGAGVGNSGAGGGGGGSIAGFSNGGGAGENVPVTSGEGSSSSNGSSSQQQQQQSQHVKNERLSPAGTPDTSSRSRSLTPMLTSQPDTPPAGEQPPLPPHAGTLTGRNYSDFMRSLAAKYNNTNPNDYFSAARNGFPTSQLDPRFKPMAFPANLMHASIGSSVPSGKEELNKKPDFSSLLNPFPPTSVFPPLIDMSTTQTLLAMVRTAKEAELQGLLKSTKRQDSSSSSPLDLSAAGAPLAKRARTKTPSCGSGVGVNATTAVGNGQSESPRLSEDVSYWSVDDVCNFVSSIDICAEYAQTFREQRIDGTGLPLLTEEHMMSTMNMKLGPALKLKSILAKKLGSCSICLHCMHCHRGSRSPDPVNNMGNTSDSGGGP